MDTNIATFIFGAIIAIIGAGVGAIISRNTALKVVRYQHYIDAADAFCDTFVEIIEFLTYSIQWDPNQDNVYTVITDSFKIIEQSKNRFRRHIKKNLPAFDRAWEEYCCEYDIDKDYDNKFDVLISSTWDEEKQNRQIMLSRIEKLLDFTKH